MIVCIAEKPSVGRDIARVLGANQQRDGYMEGNGYQVTWTFGHLCALFDPHEYNPEWKSWKMGYLPMIPERFSIKVANDRGVQKQFSTIRTLMLAADEIINCGDAGQEGELIQRWVMQKVGVTCPVKRLWISSLTEEAIKEGFENLKDQSAYQKLYEAGLMRSIGDWLLGMNATRAYTLRYQQWAPRGTKREPLSIGRVQTPTLALIVNRQEEIDHFVPRTYWELKTQYRNTTFSALIRKSEEDLLEEIQRQQEAKDKALQKAQEAKEKGKKEPKTKEISVPTLEELQATNIGIDPIPSAEAGQALIERIQTQPFIVTQVEKKKGTEGCPKLFDLTSLQVECNKKYGYSADKTLSLIQSLYEKHVTTYPRVDTTYLPDDIYPKVGGILKGIDSFFPQIARLRELMREEQARTGKAPTLPKSKKIFDSSKVTDHHAIIPTGQAPNALSAEEKKVYNLVALRFIAAFYPDCQVSTTTVFGQVTPLPKSTAEATEGTATAPNEGTASTPNEGNANAGSDDASEAPILFRTSGRQILVKGWREVFDMAKAASQAEPNAATSAASQEQSPEGDDDETADNVSQGTLPDFKKGETGPHVPALLEKQTTPPKPYSEATLLRAMETAGKMVDDDELREAMKENGIGRPSTRAAIIEKLFQRQYIVRKGKSLAPTPVGIQLIHTIHTPILKSAELTGQWEKKLRMIERGDMDAHLFLSELKQMTAEVVMEVKMVGYLCPVCKQGLIIKGRTAFGCSRWREGCTFRAPLS